MKYYLYILSLLLLCIACNEDTDIFAEDFERGGFAQFTTALEETRFNILEFSTLNFSKEITDPNNNITNYSLRLVYGDTTINDFVVINSFPANLTFTGQEVLNALNLAQEELSSSIPLRFIATITTPTGVFDGRRPDFDENTNTSTGGNTAPQLLFPIYRQAVDFSFSLFFPPPKKLRGTSFEEPFGTAKGSDYTRPSSEASSTAILMNNPDQRSVTYVAQGTGVDDELGFTTEFIDVGGSGFTTEEIGVTNDPTDVGGSFPDGEQAFQIEDIDGILKISFDRVEIDPTVNPTSGVQIQFHPIEADRESTGDIDSLVITVIVEREGQAPEEIEITNMKGDDIDAVNGLWNLASTGFLDNVTAYTLVITVQVDSGLEDIYFDQMLVFVPDN